MKFLTHIIFILKNIIRGTLTYIIPSIIQKRVGGGSSHSARYCYSVFMRHFVLLKESGLRDFPKVVAEIGPGESIGVGLAALIAGAERYYGFDVISYSIPEREEKIFEELIELFSKKTPIPDEHEFPAIKPILKTYSFPSHIFSDSYLENTLNPKRIEKIRQALKLKEKGSTGAVSYKAPWFEESITEKNSVDWIFSQAVMEHVEDLDGSYRSMATWLKKDGIMSHQIDFKSHGLSPFWNGHWSFSSIIWKLTKGNSPYLLNRKTYEEHCTYLKENHFHILYKQLIKMADGLSKKFLAKKYQKFSKDVLETAGAFIIIKKT